MDSKNQTQRKPLIALAMGMVMPGLGHLYIGQASKGITIFLLISFLSPIFGWLASSLPGGLLVPLVLLGASLSIVFYIYSLIDVYRRTKRIDGDYTLRPYNNFYTYFSAFLFGYFFIQSYLVDYSKSHFVESFNVPTHSMIPSVLPGETIFAKGSFNCTGCKGIVRRGDLATFVYPNDRTNIFIKRIIGLPGDKIKIEGFNVYVNEKLISGPPKDYVDQAGILEEPHVVVTEQGDGKPYDVIWSKKIGNEEPFEIKVPNGQVFVLGDNRTNSLDSRQFGTVPLMDVQGKASRVWLSKKEGTIAGFRWSRIGDDLEVN